MKGIAVFNANSVKGVERGVLAVGTVTLAASLLLFGGAAFNYFRQSDAQLKLATTRQQIQTLSETIAKAKKVKFQGTSTKELSFVQTALDRFAKQNECQLTEVSSNSDEGMYVSRYKKAGDDRGWKQIVIQCQVVGSLVNVLALVRQVSMIAIPIEIQSLEITPLESDKSGRSNVSAKVSIQILRQEVMR